METKNTDLDIKKYGWSRVFGKWTSEGRRYKRDYDKDFTKDFKESERLRYKQGQWIYSVDTTLFCIITALWTILPNYVEFSGMWNFMNLGFYKSDMGWSWWEKAGFLVIPGTSSFIIHKIPKWSPSKKLGIVMDAILKVIPIIILTICWYLIHTEIQVKAFKKLEKEKIIKNVVAI